MEHHFTKKTFFLLRSGVILCSVLVSGKEGLYAQSAISNIFYEELAPASPYTYSLGGRTYYYGSLGGATVPSAKQLMSFQTTDANNNATFSYNMGSPIPLQVFLRRQAPVASGNDNKDLLYYEGSRTATEARTNYPYFPNMEDNFLHRFIGMGTDNIFTNVGNTNRNSIERVDVIAQGGFFVENSLASGVAIFERGIATGHDNCVVAIVTAVDVNGFPTEYASKFIYVSTANYYQNGNAYGGNTADYFVASRDVGVGNLQSTINVDNQGIGGVYLSYNDFEIPDNTTIYGYSILPADFWTTTESNSSLRKAYALDWNNETYFPKYTGDSGNGGTGIPNGGGIDLSMVAGLVKQLFIRGNVFDDLNGIANNGVVDGVGLSNPNNEQLYVYLVQPSNNAIVAKVAVGNDGSFEIDKTAFGNLSLILSSDGSGVEGGTWSNNIQKLPTQWEYVGEDFGLNNDAGIGVNDGTGSGNNSPVTRENGIVSVQISDKDITDLKFGIRKINTTNAVNDENSTWVNTPVGGDVTTNDFDREGNMQTFGSFLNPTKTGTISSGTTVPGVNASGVTVTDAGTLAFNSDGTYTYTPATDFVGNISVPYSICDNGAPSVCDTAYLDITVSPKPVSANSVIANNDEYYTFGTTPVNSNILINDADPQGDNFSVNGFNYDSDGDGIPDAVGVLGATPVVVAGVDEKGNGVTNAGTLTIASNGDLVFTPSNGFAGQVFLDYDVIDNASTPAEDNAKIVITVMKDYDSAANDAPIPGDDFSYTRINTSVNGNFIGNDSDPNENPVSVKNESGTPITIVPGGPSDDIKTVTTTKGGSLVFKTDGTYTYTPPADYVGPDNVVYEVCDVTTIEPQPLCAEATIHLLVGAGLSLSGNVWHDVNGNAVSNPTEKPVSGNNSNNNNGTSIAAGADIYASVVDNNNTVIASVRVGNDGNYAVENLPIGGSYSVILTSGTSAPAVNSTLTAGSLPTYWSATGVNLDETPNTNNQSNVINIGDLRTNKTGINFGIQQPPVTKNSTYMIHNPSIGSQIQLNGSTPTIDNSQFVISTSQNDEDGNVVFVTVTSQLATDLPVSGTAPKLYYDGVEVTTTNAVLGSLAAPYDPELLSIEFNGLDYSSVSFNFTATDNAGKTSNESIYKLQWSAPLPVTLKAFEAAVNGGDVALTWNTYSEYNNKGFEIERSNDAKQWQKVGFESSKAPNGTSASKLDYTSVDKDVAPGVVYYRLRQIDFEGTSTISEVVLVTIKGSGIELFPNPATTMVTIKGLKGTSRVALYDMSGRKLMERKGVESGSYDMSLNDVAEGLYTIVISTSEGTVQSFKLHKK